MRYDDLSDAEMARHFMPRLAVPNHEFYIAQGDALTARAKSRLRHRLDIPYGPTPLQALDVYPADGRAQGRDGPAPMLVYIHGGYWRALDKSGYGFLADTFAKLGATTVVVNYDLCPAVSVDDIVGEIVTAIAWIHAHAGELGGDPDRVYLCGSSVGAHLAAMALAHDWAAEGPLAGFIKGTLAITGIYDVAPVLRIDANDDIRMTPAMVDHLSPLLLRPRVTAPVIVAVGGDEPGLWIQQSAAYAAMLRRHGISTELIVVPGTNHFSITQTLAEADSLMTRAARRLMKL
jgi:arylformamidase